MSGADRVFKIILMCRKKVEAGSQIEALGAKVNGTVG